MKQQNSVDIVIPVYNEEVELEESILKLHKFLTKNLSEFRWNITIADNASVDHTQMISRQLTHKLPRLSYIRLSDKGRGRAVKKAWKESKADICMYMDVDLSTDLKSIRPMLSALTNGSDIGIGSRLLPGAKVVGRALKREVLSRVYNILIKLMFFVHFSDAQCGFKAVTRKVVRELIPKIQDNAWFFDSELLIIGEKLGYKIHEEPVYWVDNPGSTVRVLGTVRGDLEGLWRLFKCRPWRK
jgi:glycosyltransferase involved in cell wall biosynthesis